NWSICATTSLTRKTFWPRIGTRSFAYANLSNNNEAAMGSGEQTGQSFPLGASVYPDGVNFSLFSRTATGVELLLFDREDDGNPSQVIPLDPAPIRSYHYWHVFVPNVRAGLLYGFRVNGPANLERGLRFDPAKVLLDPYGRGVVVPKNYDRDAAHRSGDNA